MTRCNWRIQVGSEKILVAFNHTRRFGKSHLPVPKKGNEIPYGIKAIKNNIEGIPFDDMNEFSVESTTHHERYVIIGNPRGDFESNILG